MWAPKVLEKAGIVSHTPKSRTADPNIAISPFIALKVGLLFDRVSGFCTADLPQMPGEAANNRYSGERLNSPGRLN